MLPFLLRHVAAGDRFWHFALQASAQRDESLAVRAQCVVIDTRLVIIAVQMGDRDQLHEVSVARHVLRKERQVIALAIQRGVVFVGKTARGDIHFAPDDRLDAFFLGFHGKLHGAIEGTVVRQCQRVHAERFGAIQQLVDLAQPVQ